jgi:virulence factor BrkB
VAVSLAIFTRSFSAIYRVLPDATISWRHLVLGIFVTALLFVVGKSLIGLYLGRAAPSSVYGAAGALIVLMFWMNYSAQIFLFGAELTKAIDDERTPRNGALGTIQHRVSSISQPTASRGRLAADGCLPFLSLRAVQSNQPQRQPARRPSVSINKVSEMLGHGLARNVASSLNFLSDIFGNVVRPMFQSVEGHDANRIIELPGHKFTDDGFEI